MRNRNALLVISLLVALSCAPFVGCKKRARITKFPGPTSIETDLKAVTHLYWDKNLLEMPSLYPGGKMIRGDIKRRSLACYVVAATFTNINAEGELLFYQSEEGIQKRAENYLTLKRVVISNASSDEHDNRFDEICAAIKNMHQSVFTTDNPDRCDAEFSINPLSQDSYPMITIRKHHRRTNTVELAIQQVTRGRN